MKNLLRVDVEPLSEQRRERIERALFEQFEREALQRARWPEVRRRSGRRVWLAAALVLSALMVFGLSLDWAPEQASIDHPSRITTGVSASHLALPGLALDVEPESAVVVSAETTQGMLLVLDHGSIVCQVAPRASDAPLIVQAGATRVRVVGTRFSVTREGEVARVKVFEGVVEVTAGGNVVRVGAGEEWPAAPSQQPNTSADPEPSADVEPEPSTPAVEQAPSRDAEQETKERASREAQRPSGSSSSKRSAGDSSGSSRDSEPERDPSTEAALEPSRTASQTTFEEATALERSNPARASRLYQKLESGSDSWAQNALFARGRLEASRGNSKEARRLLERYLKRFPRGSNAEDARAVLRRLR